MSAVSAESVTQRRGAYSSTSMVSAVMLPGIGPVNPFFAKLLIALTHAAACNTLLARQHATHCLLKGSQAVAQRGMRRIGDSLVVQRGRTWQ
jgi:hypothetical protein